MKDVIIDIIVGIIILGLGSFIALQFKSFKEWLVYAVTYAEKSLGSGTGQLKLRKVYDLAINSKFSFITKIITFDMFSNFVDSALVKMREMIESNEKIANVLTDVTKVLDVNEDIVSVDTTTATTTDTTDTTDNVETKTE